MARAVMVEATKAGLRRVLVCSSSDDAGRIMGLWTVLGWTCTTAEVHVPGLQSEQAAYLASMAQRAMGR